MAEKKTCTNCRKKKAPAEFYAHPRTLDRLQSQCRLCMKTGANKRNKANRKARKRAVSA
jgi:hypothetical protein